MKKFTFMLLALSTVATFGMEQLYIRNGSSIVSIRTGSSTTADIRTAYNPATGAFENTPKFVRTFTVAVGPKSILRGCVLALNNYGDYPYTGVFKAYPNSTNQPTRLVTTENSSLPHRKGWVNHIFEVNAGQGNYINGMEVHFKHRPYVEACNFELSYDVESRHN